ncbi:MAG: preprotein translocase subunit SecY [Candidatus Gribaldobacteria bacterium]|nr:preprotein translocase subunit SecY [Candidatus Gribaldobacteria bacterium]
MVWHQKLLFVFKDKQLRNKILFVLGVFVVFRLAANIPVLGVDVDNLKRFIETNQYLGLMNLFVGGTLSSMSIVMLGLGPYITGVIIIQLLTMIFPKLEKMQKEEGEAGKAKFNQYGRMLTVPLAALQGYAMIALFRSGSNPVIGALTPLELGTAILTIVVGALFLMWLGELITEKGIGNGVSLLIFAGIVDRTPVEIYQLIGKFQAGGSGFLLELVGFLVMALIIIAGVVFITEAKRNIPVSYAKRVKGNRVYGGASTYLPININPAGVIPIIFALSILMFPAFIANFLSRGGNQIIAGVAGAVNSFLQPGGWSYGIMYFILVFLFTYFYTAVTFDPKSISENLQKMGGFVPGIRPGRSTAEFLQKILYRTLFLGASSLGLIAVMPSIIQYFTPDIKELRFLIGGTSLLIVVSVVLETWRQLKAQMEMREYDRF